MKLNYYQTTCENKVCLSTNMETVFEPDGGREEQLLNLYPDVSYQRIEGFGGAITDASGSVFNKMPQMQQQELLKEYFDSDNMNYSIARIPMDSCDFSEKHYEAMSDATDRELKSFQLDRVEETIFPMLKQSEEALGGQLELMLTPWSPPAFMKTNGERNHGGSLKKEYQDFWADYLCRYIIEFKKRGFQVKRISIQNEAKAVQTWDSCVYTPEEEKEFLKDHLWPAFEKNNLTDVEIFIWDHNKERAYERACKIIDESTNHMIAGIALHWYSGDHFEALRILREKFPNKKLILSEACIEYRLYGAETILQNAQKYAHEMIGNFKEGLCAFYDWNLLLNEDGGPNHVGNYCESPYMYKQNEYRLLRNISADYIWHFSHFIKPSAVRIGSSVYTDKLESAAFRNTDGSIIVVLLNQTEKDIPVYIRTEEQCALVIAKAESMNTGVIQ